jgi:hypothetical protein
MRLRTPTLLSAIAFALAVAPRASAQAVPGSRGLSSIYFGGDNVRVTAGQATPRGGMHNWESGLTLGLAWESWDPGRNGPPRLAVGLAGSYSKLPFARSTFITDFESTTGRQVTQASASDAAIADLLLTVRVRGPAVVVMPSMFIGVGYYSFTPGTIVFQATDSAGTARSRRKNGPAANIGLSLDGPTFARAALFADALFAYGWSSDNYLSRSATSRCGGNTCDAFKSTQTTMIRGGVRVRVGRL